MVRHPERALKESQESLKLVTLSKEKHHQDPQNSGAVIGNGQQPPEEYSKNSKNVSHSIKKTKHHLKWVDKTALAPKWIYLIMHPIVTGLLDAAYRPHGNILDVINDRGKWGPLPFEISPQNYLKTKRETELKKKFLCHLSLSLSLSFSLPSPHEKRRTKQRAKCMSTTHSSKICIWLSFAYGVGSLFSYAANQSNYVKTQY